MEKSIAAMVFASPLSVLVLRRRGCFAEGICSQGIEAGNDKALGFEKPFDIDAVMSGVFESYFCIFHRLTVKSIQDRFKKSVKTSPVIRTRSSV